MSNIQKSNNPLLSNDENTINIGDIFIRNKIENDYPLLKILSKDKSENSELYLITFIPLNYDGTEYYKDKRTKQKYLSHILDYFTKFNGELSSIIEDVEKLDNGSFIFQHNESEQNSLIGKASKQVLEIISLELSDKIAYFENVNILLRAKHQKLENELIERRNKLLSYKNSMMAQLDKANKTIQIIELYLGIEEEIVQILEGEKASDKDILHIRQLVLFMDEECAIIHHEDQGLDFSNVDKFDKWLIQNNNFEKIIPEQKCIVAFRPRRRDKDYGDSFYNSTLNIHNKQRTYILCRNGKNLYRVFTEKISPFNVLFPKKNEIQNESIESKNSSWGAKELDKKIHEYKTIIGLLQGLIDRANLFDLAGKVNLGRIENSENFKLVYDAEDLLTDGHITFREWKRNLQDSIVEGTRVLNAAIYGGNGREKDRLFYWLNSDWKVPSPPQMGVYQVYQKKDYKNQLYISYLPDEDIWVMGDDGHWDQRKRKKKIHWKIDVWDDFLLNYDQLDLETIDYFLNSRVDRVNYVKMIPALLFAKKELLKEFESEKEFKKGLFEEILRIDKSLKEDFVLSKIEELVKWWKLKNKWKRYISSDDEKAWRMIISKFKKDNF